MIHETLDRAADLAEQFENALDVETVYTSPKRGGSVVLSSGQATEVLRRLERLERLEEVAEALIAAEQDHDGPANAGAMEQLYRLMEEGR